MVPEQAGLVGDVEAGVETEAGAQPPLVVAQHLVARQTEDRGHIVQVCHLTALAPSQVPEQCICKIPSALGGSGSPASRAFFLRLLLVPLDPAAG